MTLDFGDHAALAGAFTFAIGLARIIEKVAIQYLSKKGGDPAKVQSITVVRFSDEVSRTMAETRSLVEKMGEIVLLRDADGVPLTHESRSLVKRMDERLQDLQSRHD
jgi:hypothetical protein